MADKINLDALAASLWGIGNSSDLMALVDLARADLRVAAESEKEPPQSPALAWDRWYLAARPAYEAQQRALARFETGAPVRLDQCEPSVMGPLRVVPRLCSCQRTVPATEIRIRPEDPVLVLVCWECKRERKAVELP